MPEDNPRSRIKELEDQIELMKKEFEQFGKDLIKSLQFAEKKHNLILLPEGKYFGITIE